TQSQFCHFDQDTSRSGVSPGEIYSVLSLPHYAQKLWVNSQNDKRFVSIGLGRRKLAAAPPIWRRRIYFKKNFADRFNNKF
ncbi:MAG: hypothetical protein PHN94_05385, partial [Bacteroidales bacterium]|nr:hypothetical protein [Bacteroidales bacterium]